MLVIDSEILKRHMRLPAYDDSFWVADKLISWLTPGLLKEANRNRRSCLVIDESPVGIGFVWFCSDLNR
jgi:hypothetical protein